MGYMTALGEYYEGDRRDTQDKIIPHRPDTNYIWKDNKWEETPKPVDKLAVIDAVQPGKIVVRDEVNWVEGKTLNELSNYPRLFYRFADSSYVIKGGQLIEKSETRQRYNSLSYQNPAALNDTFQFEASIDAGLYELKVLGMKDKDCGILTLSINRIAQPVQIDWYDRNNIFNVENTVQITAPSKGLNVFVFTCSAKNPASSGYKIPLTRFSLAKL